MRILIIEDERSIAEIVSRRLKEHYIVDTAATGRHGAHLAQVCQYDLIVLDLHLPDMSGLEICHLIRNEQIKAPILVLTAHDEPAQKVTLLDAGADDYLTKPFHYNELTARIRALLRRPNEAILNNTLSFHDLTLHLLDRQASWNGQIIKLRRKEFDLLEYLLRNKGQVLSREMILEHV